MITSTTSEVVLTPVQQDAFEQVRIALERDAKIVTLVVPAGFGRTTILNELARTTGGHVVSLAELSAFVAGRDPIGLEESYAALLRSWFNGERTIYIDDYDLLEIWRGANGWVHFRSGFIDTVPTSLTDAALRHGCNVVFGVREQAPMSIQTRPSFVHMRNFSQLDYDVLLRQWLDAAVLEGIDLGIVYRYAGGLTAHQLRKLARWIEPQGKVTAEEIVEHLRTEGLASNVDVEEIRPVKLHSLRGIEDVIESLEMNIVLPFEDDALATKLNLRPKRGVLLHGPPGTGKTTVGRALAHRLGSKFFMIDGRFNPDLPPTDFHAMVDAVFLAAEKNAPSIVFIDDADVIFGGGGARGLYRYLLTKLDGLESEAAGKICVMITAMDVRDVPAALIRSGRIELWLELRPPTAQARREILQEGCKSMPEFAQKFDVAALDSLTEGFVGADLKRLAMDVKALYAYDLVNKLAIRPADAYFLEATNEIQANKQRFRAAEASVETSHLVPSGVTRA